MNNEILDIVKCPYCNNSIIDSELICSNCIPKASIDMAINDIQIAVSTLVVNKESLTDDRKEMIWSIIEKMDQNFTSS